MLIAVFISRMEENRMKLAEVTNNHHKLSLESQNLRTTGADQPVDLLTKRQKDAIDMQNGVNASDGDSDSTSSQEDGHASAVLLGSSIAVKNAVRPIKLPEVKKLPPYTTWIFLDRNQRMTEDQSVVGRRRIYYDQNGGEALIASDSEEEAIDEEEEKREFLEAEDYIIRMTIQQLGSSDVVSDLLAQRLSRKPSELKARYEVLVNRENDVEGCKPGNVEFDMSSLYDKDLEAALDSFDNLFCRRCLVFDCKLHGCSQDLIFPAEKHSTLNRIDEEKVPCGPNCYRQVQKLEGNMLTSSIQPNSEQKDPPSSDGNCVQASKKKSISRSLLRRLKSSQSENTKNMSESSDSDTRPLKKRGTRQRNSKRIADHVMVTVKKRQKKLATAASDSDSVASGSLGSKDIGARSNSHKENEEASSCSLNAKPLNAKRGRPKKLLVPDSKEIISAHPSKEEFVDESIGKQEVIEFKSWKTIEKSLFEKGLEIFGRNSCLIARNLMNGMKTCAEVFHAMNCSENKLSSNGGDCSSFLGDGSRVDSNENGGTALRRRSRFLRRRGKIRRLKYSWKSAGYHSMRKRISDKKELPCRQYNPCGCQTACGKECSCLVSGTCCEKYCGCPKTCKNRFRGCHCAKSQCRSRQCPCFAAGRECDPDVCRNCWIGCGDGTLGIPGQRGDNYECRNMKLLLKQQQRVLLGRSDVSGWGAFLKNSVSKHEYLGEYTGELISHREADKRGKIYDRENSSFLFNLNDQYVLDAYRKGDKLKFANHSPVPNCYAKVIMVAGDHRVGIFAKERICAGEELFYDYRYEPDRAPAWAKKPESAGSKREDTGPSTGRAKKLA
ncbi:histone-lysine N-methyltransferase CLF isoform X2 [Rutidosis leptorrhynchoides]|uniref:histone-lysine N-methyltransferase CLF isoform X2 n=1 Tax=Rutidosis leptorrhynchoides TaxID=125765 RepID=UPI003A99A62E